AERTFRVLAELELAERHLPRIEQQQAVEKDPLGAENDLDHLVCLDRADDPWQYSKHAALCTGRDQPRRRRLRIQAAIARSLLCPEDARLPFEPKDRTVNIWF